MATISPLSVRVSAALDDELLALHPDLDLEKLSTGINFDGLSSHLATSSIDAEKLAEPIVDPVTQSVEQRDPPLTVEVTIQLEDQ